MRVLTSEQVCQIRERMAARVPQREIAKEFGVSRSLIGDISTGRRYGDVASPDHDHRAFKKEAEIVHLREELSGLRRQLKVAAKSQGLFQAVVDVLETKTPRMKPLPRAPRLPKTSGEIVEHLVMHLSDGHHDQIVTKSDTGGLEQYDFQVSCCRAEKYIDTLLKWTQRTLAPQFRFPSITVLAYGDHTSGEIHGHVARSYFKNQFKNCLAIGQLHARMYRDLAPYFEHVNILYVPGNHGRRSVKKDFHGAHDNWDYLIAKVAELHLRDVDNITFQIPNSFCANLEICGIGFQVFHGDDVRSSLGIPHYGLEKRRHRMKSINAVQGGAPIRYFCCGHFHRHSVMSEVDGEMLINGAWTATDAYAYNSLGGYTEPTQLIHGVNKEHGITWRLPVKIRCEYEQEGPKRYKI